MGALDWIFSVSRIQQHGEWHDIVIPDNILAIKKVYIVIEKSQFTSSL